MTGRFGIVVAGLVLLSASEALACKCSSFGYERAVENSDFVVEGRLLASTLGPDDRVLVVQVDRVIKGAARGRVEIRTARKGPGCGWNGDIGRSYRFGGGIRPEDRKFRIGTCRMIALNDFDAPPLGRAPNPRP